MSVVREREGCRGSPRVVDSHIRKYSVLPGHLSYKRVECAANTHSAADENKNLEI